MLGLLVKDLYLLKKNRKLFIVFGGIACIFALTNNGNSAIMSVAYFTMGIIIAVIVVGAMSFLTKLNVDVEGVFTDIVTMLSNFSGAVIIAGVLLILACLLFLSVIITTKILNKMEY